MEYSGLSCFHEWVVMHLSKEYLNSNLMSFFGMVLVIFVYGS